MVLVLPGVPKTVDLIAVFSTCLTPTLTPTSNAAIQELKVEASVGWWCDWIGEIFNNYVRIHVPHVSGKHCIYRLWRWWCSIFHLIVHTPQSLFYSLWFPFFCSQVAYIVISSKFLISHFCLSFCKRERWNGHHSLSGVQVSVSDQLFQMMPVPSVGKICNFLRNDLEGKIWSQSRS